MKVPASAQKVFQGVIFSVYQWQQQMFDGTTEIFEMLKRPNTIEIIATQGDKILLSRQSQPTKHNYYALFGGRAEENEEPLVTAQRELLEESGLVSDDWELIKIYQPMHKIDWEIYLFVARNCKKIGEPDLDPGERIETISCSFSEFVKIVEHDDYWGIHLTLDLFKMQQEKTLDIFKNRLLST
ncbi:MAG TPA: NUDIX hydrolase [Patescibacteria group bacterium]